MPNIICMSDRLRRMIEADLHGLGATKAEIGLLEQVPSCPSGRDLEAKGKRGGKRAPSAYNIFIGNCMKGGESNLKECAAEWKAEKKGK